MSSDGGRGGRRGPLDGFRIFTKDELPKVVAELRAQVDEFAGTRQEQIDAWAPDASPTVGDALAEVGVRVDRIAGEARQAIGGWLENLGGVVKGGAEFTVEEPIEVAIEAAPDAEGGRGDAVPGPAAASPPTGDPRRSRGAVAAEGCGSIGTWSRKLQRRSSTFLPCSDCSTPVLRCNLRTPRRGHRPRQTARPLSAIRLG